MERSSDSGSDNMVFSDIGVSRKTVPVTSFYGTTSGRCQGRDEEARFREDRLSEPMVGWKDCTYGCYFIGAVRNENTSCKGVGSLGDIVGSSGWTDRFLVRDLLRLLIAYLLNTVFSVPVKRGRLYRTGSDYKGMRSLM
jgi:hypothetical protein